MRLMESEYKFNQKSQVFQKQKCWKILSKTSVASSFSAVSCFFKSDIKEDNFKFQKLRRTLLVRRRRRWIRTRLRNTLNTAQPG